MRRIQISAVPKSWSRGKINKSNRVDSMITQPLLRGKRSSTTFSAAISASLSIHCHQGYPPTVDHMFKYALTA